MWKISSYGDSDKGLRREKNEDSFVTGNSPVFFAVADGMGGAASGEVASKIFTDTALEVVSKDGKISGDDVGKLIETAFQTANSRIFEKAENNPEHKGMGCTAELLLIYDNSYMVGHVGDSRIYRFREKELRQITKDHSFVQDEIDKGLITPEEARHHAYRSVILRAVGIHEKLDVDLVSGDIKSGDIYMLCSDGLTDLVEDSSIAGILSKRGGVKNKVKKLIDLALKAGGDDNVTVVLCQVKKGR
jgi:serine/threonine protein phosphatase PrpC